MNAPDSQWSFEERMRAVQVIVIGAGLLLIFVALAESRRRQKDRD
jgi:hypothetical protein